MESMGIGTNVVTQIGLVVENIEDAIDSYCSILGLPRPSVILTDRYEVAKTTYRGKPSFAQAKLAFFDMGQVQIELIEPVGEPSTWKETLDAHGYGVHHIAFQIKDSDQVVAHLESKGVALIQQGHYTGGMYSYLDASKQLGVILELLENF